MNCNRIGVSIFLMPGCYTIVGIFAILGKQCRSAALQSPEAEDGGGTKLQGLEPRGRRNC
jgi:hypothetical protein